MFKPNTNLFYNRMMVYLRSAQQPEAAHVASDEANEKKAELAEKKEDSKEKINESIEKFDDAADKVLSSLNFPERKQFKEKAEKVKNDVKAMASYKAKIDSKSTAEEMKKVMDEYAEKIEEAIKEMNKIKEYDKAFKSVYDAMEKRYDSEKDRLTGMCYLKADHDNVSLNEVSKVVRAYLLRWHIAFFKDLVNLDDEKILDLSKQAGKGGKLNIGNMDGELKAIEKQLERVTRYWSKEGNKESKNRWYRRVYKNKDWENDTETLHFPEGYGYKAEGYEEVKTPDWGTDKPDEPESDLEKGSAKEGFKPLLEKRTALISKFKTLLGGKLTDQQLADKLKALVPNAENKLGKPFINLIKDWTPEMQKPENLSALNEEVKILTEAVFIQELKETDKIENVHVFRKGNKLLIEVKGKKAGKETLTTKEVDLTFTSNFNMTYGTSNLIEQVREIENRLLLLNIVPPEVYAKIPNLRGMVQQVIDKAKPKIVVTGKASFDGDYDGNVKLANYRADTIINKIKAKGYKGFTIEKKTIVVHPATGLNVKKQDLDGAWKIMLGLRSSILPKMSNMNQLKAELNQYNNNMLKDPVLKGWYDNFFGNQRGVGIEITPTTKEIDFNIPNATTGAAPAATSSLDIPPAAPEGPTRA